MIDGVCIRTYPCNHYDELDWLDLIVIVDCISELSNIAILSGRFLRKTYTVIQLSGQNLDYIHNENVECFTIFRGKDNALLQQS